MKHRTLIAMAAALSLPLLTACTSADPYKDLTPSERVTQIAIESAIASDVRTEKDLALDASRKPAETLAFAGISPGDTVLEMEAGAGYFTQILSSLVGPQGRVYMQNPKEFAVFFGDTGLPPRLPTLEQTVYLAAPFQETSLADNAVDTVTWFQGPHEIWYTPEGATEQLGDPAKVFAEIARVLKPGGEFIVIDHAAPAGAPATTGGDTHRIDPQIIKDKAASAGLQLVAESDLLANPDDDLTVNVFDPSVRRKTDQFLFKFQKAE